MAQNYSSANTSINSTRLPALYHKVDFDALFDGIIPGDSVVDIGCGKWDNGKDFVEKIGLNWYGYDPFNRPGYENNAALRELNWLPAAVLCSNVLNVIDSDVIIGEVAELIQSAKSPYFVTVYEGDGCGVGRQTGPDQWQRNEKTREYLKYFPGAVIRKNVITNYPEGIK